jgi:hypothetical protein
MMYPRFCSSCEQRYDICHCTPADGYDNEFEAMLEEPDEGTLERLKGSMPSTIMVLRGMRARHVPRRLRRASSMWSY